MNDVLRIINDQHLDPRAMRLTPAYLAELLKLVDTGVINITTGKSLLQVIQDTGKSPGKLVDEKGLAQVKDDTQIRAICSKVIQDHPEEVSAFRNGKENLIGWFVGQVMRESRGKADAKMAKDILADLLSE